MQKINRATIENEKAAAPSGAAPIDFHSAEFNRIDDLNDFSGICRSFQTLEGVVTADMRHQLERQIENTSLDRPADEGPASKKMETESAQDEAVETPLPLTLISRGRTLIIDTDAERAGNLGKILSARQLTCTLMIAKSPPTGASFPGPAVPGCLAVEGLSISGAFGGFWATVTKGKAEKPTDAMDDRRAVFDLVLDLQPRPSYKGDCLPLGYYAPKADPAALEQALAELPEMRGQFKKPRFISMRKNRCFHGRSAARDCRRCLEICPFGAIRTSDRRISIDPYLCQGCAGCVLVCPAEALRLNGPSPAELLDRLRSRLENRSSDLPISLVVFDSEWPGVCSRPGLAESPEDQTVYFKVEQIARTGMEVPLTALALGAENVRLVCGPQNPPGIQKALEEQMLMARTILQRLALPEDKIRFVVSPSEGPDSMKEALQPLQSDGPALVSPGPPETFVPWPDKRGLVRLAVRDLYDRSGAGRPDLPLPAGSPFGAIAVDGASCTLCLACVTACPSEALSAGGQMPQLTFREALCHQCGLCQETCPEGAIRLLPRLLCDLEAVETPLILHEDQPFRCSECGLAFSTPAMIKRMQEKLLGHWMYAEERQLRRLRMCGPCRTRDTLMSEDLSLWNHR